ncbi:MAG: DUF362 domain-containing protein, partial [Chloroflexi bacterium]|nr:DUF362 domain-containing protein [Chloroflexota bacterium]
KDELNFYYDPANLPGIDIEISHAPNPDHYVLVEFEKWQNELSPDVDLKDINYRGPALNLNAGYQKTEGSRLRVARQLQEAPVIINMPVLKRHMAAYITSALKNNFGSVYGAHRWIAHAAYSLNSDYYSRRLAEFASAVRPELTITDIRSLQAVSGPYRMANTSIIHGVNRLIITGDMVAADTVAMDIMKKWDNTFTPKHEAFVRSQHIHAEKLGLGSSDLSKFEVIHLKV